MAARALTAAAAAGLRTGAKPRLLLLPSSCSSGVRENHSVTGARVEEALNRKDVEELELNPQGEELHPDEPVTVGAGAGEWVPDGETGVFAPADAATPINGGSSVLDQAVFVREEEMEDVERPAIDVANASPNANGGSSN